MNNHYPLEFQDNLTYYNLTHALVGSDYNPIWWRGAILVPPVSPKLLGILKIQTAFDSPVKTVDRKLFSLTLESLMTSQVRSKVKCCTVQWMFYGMHYNIE